MNVKLLMAKGLMKILPKKVLLKCAKKSGSVINMTGEAAKNTTGNFIGEMLKNKEKYNIPTVNLKEFCGHSLNWE